MRSRQRRQPNVDRLPPHSPEAEQGVLGCVLLAPEECLGECMTRVKAEAFYDLRHQRIYAAMSALGEERRQGSGTPVDLITVQEWLRKRNELEEVGGLSYLDSLTRVLGSAAQLPYYLEIVEEKFVMRRMIRALVDGTVSAYEHTGKVEEWLDQVEAAVLAVNERNDGEARTLPELVGAVGDLVDNLHRGVGIIGGLRTRFSYFDKMTGGLHRKEMAVIAARPSLGKTSWMLNIAVNVAKTGVPVGIFSMEMSAEDLTLRMCCSEAGIDFHKLRTGFPTKEDVEQFYRVAPRVAQLPIRIDDKSALGIQELRARARRMVRKHKVQLFGIDYLQLMHGSKDFGGNRALEVGEISGGIKAMAKELDVAVMVLSQLNRELERQKNRKPQLADLRESGAIEQDADMVGLLYRPKSDEDEEEGDCIPVTCLVAKQRNGPTGDCQMIFNRPQMRMMDAYERPFEPTPAGPVAEPVTEAAMPTNAELGLE